MKGNDMNLVFGWLWLAISLVATFAGAPEVGRIAVVIAVINFAEYRIVRAIKESR